MYQVKNIDNPNWKSYPYLVIRDNTDSGDKALAGYWFYGAYKNLSDAFLCARELSNGVLVETKDVIPFEERRVRGKEFTPSNLVVNVIIEKAAQREKHIRFGQAIFNISYSMFPDEADRLRGTEWDCFYDDSRVTGFLEKLEEYLG